MDVRHATDDDLPALLELSAAFYAASGYDRDGPFNALHTAAMIGAVRAHGILLVAQDAGGEVVGMVALMIGPGLCNAALKASEVAWWVDPDQRHSRAGLLLLRAIEPAARAAGCIGVQMTLLPSSPSQVADVYRRLGYIHTETSFTKHWST